MEYAICVHGEIQDLVKDVNRHTELGWEPTGGVSVVLHSPNSFQPFMYAQAIIKKDHTPTEKS